MEVNLLEGVHVLTPWTYFGRYFLLKNKNNFHDQRRESHLYKKKRITRTFNLNMRNNKC